MFGKINEYEVEKNVVKILFEVGQVHVTILDSNTINFFSPTLRKERRSKAVEKFICQDCNFTVTKIDNGISIITEVLKVNIFNDFIVDIYDKDNNLLCEDYKKERNSFIRRGRNAKLISEEGHKFATDAEYKVYIAKKMEEDMFFYGFGEKTGHLNKRGYHYRNWNTDNPQPHGETFEQLYKSIPFFIVLRERQSYGIFFDNTFETHFDMGKENSEYFYFASVDGNLDYYFIYGPEVKDVVVNYTKLTGTQKLPQLWTLGYQQSRFSYATEDRVLEVARTLREKDIPCDAIHLDIDYMDGFRVFTTDRERFPSLESTISRLNKEGFKVVPIIDPGVKKDKGYRIYDDGIEKRYFATDKDGITYVNRVWPGDSVYPDFLNSQVRKWWGNNHKVLTDIGVAGIWTDMNEPASFNGELPEDVIFNEDGLEITHKEIHNVYGHLMCKATYEGIKDQTGKRPFVITRACYAGSQKYSTFWTGDNQSTWEHLRMAVPMLMNMGLSGLAFCGTDVGGFGFDSTGELLSRWVQLGAFSPLFRNHTIDHSRDQEPWAFDSITEEINRKYIKLRYELLPYMYDLMWQCENTGAPIIRPLFFNYEKDKNTYELNDQFLCGENILVAPILEQGKRIRLVYLPKGDNWIDFWTSEEHKGGQYVVKEAPLDICPIYIKAGSVIPNYEPQNYVGEHNRETLILNIYLSENHGETSYLHYFDDGETFNYENGIYNLIEVRVNAKDNIKIDVVSVYEKYDQNYKFIKLNIFNAKDKQVHVNIIGKDSEIKEYKNKIVCYQEI